MHIYFPDNRPIEQNSFEVSSPRPAYGRLVVLVFCHETLQNSLEDRKQLDACFGQQRKFEVAKDAYLGNLLFVKKLGHKVGAVLFAILDQPVSKHDGLVGVHASFAVSVELAV